MASKVSSIIVPGREPNYSVLHKFRYGEPLNVIVDGAGHQKLLMQAITMGDGSGKEFVISARIAGSDNQLLRVFYDTRTGTGTIGEFEVPSSISRFLYGPKYQVVVKNGPSRDEMILSLALDRSHRLVTSDFHFEYNHLGLPRESIVSVSGIESTSEKNWLLLLARVENMGRNGRSVVIHYQFHKRTGSVLLIKG